MREIVFQAGGPVPGDSQVYIERASDREIQYHLRQMSYVQLIEPHDQGKTSLIYRLRTLLPGPEYHVVYVNAKSLSRLDEAEWYRELARRLCGQLHNVIQCDQIKLPN